MPLRSVVFRVLFGNTTEIVKPPVGETRVRYCDVFDPKRRQTGFEPALQKLGSAETKYVAIDVLNYCRRKFCT